MSEQVKSWIVEMECIVRKRVVCEKCTELQAKTNPWDYAQDEVETQQVDWQVMSVKPNE